MFGLKRIADHIVLERIKQGDEKVLVYLHKAHYSMIRNFILNNNGDETVVEDMMQETLLAVWRNVNQPSFLLQAKLSTYIMAITKNLWFKELKKRSKFTVVDEHHQMDKADTDDAKDLDHSIVVDMVRAMDETCRKLLSYFYFDGLSNAVIAEKLGFSNTNSVKSKKYQCFKKLQATVTEKYTMDDLL